jgi:predicted RNA-binding protein with EMAP domain
MMTNSELKQKIRNLARSIYNQKQKSTKTYVEYDELNKFPELKSIIIDLLTTDFDSFVSSIDWVAPKPTTFRINLKNGQEFYLIYLKRSWMAQVEGKKYYLLNLPEQQRATEAIARTLRYSYQPEKEILSSPPTEAPQDEEEPETEETPQ